MPLFLGENKVSNVTVAFDGSGTSFTLQSKSVSPTESTQTVSPDSGYDGLSKVTVGAIQTETKTITSNGTVTPSSGKYLKKVIVNVPSSGIDTSDATATVNDIAKDKTAYVAEGKVTGSLLSTNGFNFDSAVASWDSQNSKLMLSAKNPIRCIVSANGTSKMYCTGDKLGDATAADVVSGKTFTSAAGLKVTGTHVCSGGIDTSDATATADDIVDGKTAYVNGQKVTGSVNEVTGDGTILTSDNMTFETVDSTKYIKIGNITRYVDMLFRKSASLHVRVKAASFGNATAADVAQGKTFTSATGLKVTGTATASTPTLQSKTVTPSTSQQTITPDNSYDGLSSVTVEAMPSGALNAPTVNSSGLITAQIGTSGYLASGTKTTKQLTTQAAQTITPGTADKTIASGKYLTGVQTIKGDANLVAGNIKKGVSIFGVAGSYSESGSSGGSSTNNCEAYHITSTSDTISFNGTGTVKVWGYGTINSGYTTSVCAFVGDGYYRSASWGSPSKTNASFSINSNGTLSGLPNGLGNVNLLVEIGV